MLGCELMFENPDDATRLQATVEEATGQPCPCKQGQPCPMVPGEVLLIPRLFKRRPRYTGVVRSGTFLGGLAASIAVLDALSRAAGLVAGVPA